MSPLSDLDDESLARLSVVASDPRATRELLLRYRPVARGLARRYSYTSEPQEDLEQVACTGFLAALPRFDPSRGSRLRAFAIPSMLGELRRHFRDKAWSVRVPRSLQERAQRVSVVVDDLTNSCGRAPTIAEIAGSAGLSSEEVIEAIEVRHAYRANSLELPSDGDRDERHRSPVPIYEDNGFHAAEVRVTLDRALRALPARERAIVALRFQRDLNQAEIGGLLGISQMHVSRLLSRALCRMALIIEAVDERIESNSTERNQASTALLGR